MSSLNVKTAIVTGGTGALGKYVVEKFCAEGYKVYIPVTSINKFMRVFDSSLDENSEFKLRKIYAFECDALEEDSVKEFVEKVSGLENGRIDVLVNTIGGIHPPVNTADVERQEFDKWFNLNFTTALHFSKSVLKIMVPNGCGRIVSVGAIAGLEPAPGRLAYSVSKSALIILMNTISKEYKRFGIRANTVIPSVIDTQANREWASAEEIKNWVSPEEVARVIFELAENRFSAVRESVIKVFGNY